MTRLQSFAKCSMTLAKWGVFLLACFYSRMTWGQTEYAMADMTVTDCNGILTDSGEGEEYSSNEALTFIVEMEEVIPISISFSQNICIEDGFDFLTIWDGLPDAGVLLASITGIDYIPDDLLANSGTVAFVFTSDNSLNLCGFELEWEGLVSPPAPPTLTQLEVETCGITGMTFDMVPAIGCSEAYLDSLLIIDGPEVDWNLADAELLCTGDSATGVYIPFNSATTGNCQWTLQLPLDVRDACDSTHHFQVLFDAAVITCPISGSWNSPGNAVCLGNCYEIHWTADGCAEHITTWIDMEGGTPIPEDELPQGVDAGLMLCFDNLDTLTLSLQVEQPTASLSTTFSHILSAQNLSITTTWDEPICSTSEDFTLEAIPLGGTWSGAVYADGSDWYFNTSEAAADAVSNGSNPPQSPITYTTPEGCMQDTTFWMQWVDAGPDLASCFGAETFLIEGSSNLPAAWSGPGISPDGMFTPDSIGLFQLIIDASGCSDTMAIEILPDNPPQNLGGICQSEGWMPLPEINDAGFWTGPALSNDGFDPGSLPGGWTTWYFNLTGCTQLAQANILPIGLGLGQFASCPAEDPFIPSSDFYPVGGTWTGPGIINASSGLFDPGSAPEGWSQPLIYNAPNGCVDTIFVNNITTFINSNLIETCALAEEIDLHNGNVGAIPWCGTWSGDWPGASATTMSSGSGSSIGLSVDNWCDWSAIPNQIEPGIYTLIFEANTCQDSVDFQVFPAELGLDPVIICNDESPLELAPEGWPLGGFWSGSGVNSTSGLLTPENADTGWQDVIWTAPGGCSDIVSVNVEAWQQATFVGLDSIWCFQDLWWEPNLVPSNNSIWFLNETLQTSIEIAALDTGYHELMVFWNGDVCASADTTSIYMLPPLQVELTVTDSVLCPGQATSANASSWGGLPDALPTWSWSHGGFPIATTTLQTDSSLFLVVTAADGCSDPALDSSFIAVLPSPEWNITLSDTLCFGEVSTILMELQSPGYELFWNGSAINPDVVSGNTSTWVLESNAGAATPWALSESNNGCTTIGEVIAPAFSPLSAGFSVNPGLDCIPWDFLPLQLIDYSQFASSGEWSAVAFLSEGETPEVWSHPYESDSSPLWQPEQPGNFQMILQLENEGGCIETDTAFICVHAPVNWFLADQFSPNGDLLNDELVLRSQPLDAFEMKVFNRWGELVFITEDSLHGWDGTQRERAAPSGVYAVQLNMHFSDGTRIQTSRHVTLVR